MVSVGQGANEAVRKEIARLGTNLVVILPGAATSGGARGGSGSASTLTVADAQAIRREAAAVGEVSYLIRQSGQISFFEPELDRQHPGVSPNYPPMTNWRIAAGREITPEDDRNAGLVVVLGETVPPSAVRSIAESHWRRGAGQGVPLQVIGILESKGQTSFGTDQDDLIMVPFSTAERKILGVAAPSQQQTAVNWIYPVPPNPYGFSGAMVGYVNQIYVQAIDQAAFRMPSSKRLKYWPAAIASGRAPPTTSRCATSARSQKPPKAAAGSWRFCWQPWRRYRSSSAGWDHEYPACVGDRADAGDWIAHGHRRPTIACAAAVFWPRRCS